MVITDVVITDAASTDAVIGDGVMILHRSYDPDAALKDVVMTPRPVVVGDGVMMLRRSYEASRNCYGHH